MKDRIKKVMATVFKLDTVQIADDIDPDTIEVWDSLNHINLILALEKEFKVKIEGVEVIEMITLDVITKVIKNKKCL